MEELNYPEIKSAEKELLLDFEAGMSRSMGNRGKTIWHVWNESREEAYKSIMMKVMESMKGDEAPPLMSSYGQVKNLVKRWGGQVLTAGKITRGGRCVIVVGAGQIFSAAEGTDKLKTTREAASRWVKQLARKVHRGC